MPNSPLSIGFNVPFTEAISESARRGVVLPDVYYGQLQGIARQHAFSVAGLTSLDQLQSVKDSLDKAISDGESFNSWRERVTSDGTLTLPNHRLDNIYRTNMQGSYMAGKWQQFEVTASARPFLIYDAINDTRTRPAHKALDGIIRRMDDVFWQSHSPPNGYRCRCSLISLREDQARDRSRGDNGLNKKPVLEDGMPAEPDKGWNYNPSDRLGGIKAAIESRKETVSNALLTGLDDKLKEKELMTDRDYLKSEGAKLLDDILARRGTATSQHAELVRQLRKQVAMTKPATATYLGGNSKTAQKWLESATTLLPDSWTDACDSFGKLSVKASKAKNARGFCGNVLARFDVGDKVDIGKEFGVVRLETKNEGFLFIDSRAEPTALHEFCHRVQAALPELDAIFQAEHQARTAGDALEQLRHIIPNSRYDPKEVARRDKYIEPYFGKEYGDRNALEIMSMSIEALLGVTGEARTMRKFTKFVSEDRDLANLVVGVLLKWRPL